MATLAPKQEAKSALKVEILKVFFSEKIKTRYEFTFESSELFKMRWWYLQTLRKRGFILVFASNIIRFKLLITENSLDYLSLCLDGSSLRSVHFCIVLLGDLYLWERIWADNTNQPPITKHAAELIYFLLIIKKSNKNCSKLNFLPSLQIHSDKTCYILIIYTYQHI